VNVVDSSAWLEYFSDGPNAQYFAKPIETVRSLLVPTISLYEVFKRILVQRGEDAALQAVALMQQGRIVELSVSLSLSAAKVGAELGLPMADSMILATARAHEATLWTQDADFADIDGVKYFPKQIKA
jgi:predicted nucleic acid-binding protein